MSAERPQPTPETLRSIRNHGRAGLALIVGLGGGLTVWSAMAQISGAVIASGQVAVESSAKRVQHPEGGVVAELRVQEGARVSAGDLLIRLDDTVVSANLAILVKSLDEQTAQEARLVAERDATPLRFPAALLARAAESAEARLSIAGQTTIHESRRTAHETAKTQVAEQIVQLEAMITGLAAQRLARDSELRLIGEELKGVRDLYAKNLVPVARLNALDRDRARIEGERGKLTADIASARASIAEKRVQLTRAADDFRSEVVKELSEVRARMNEAIERKVAAQDRLSRIAIRAPATGRVHMLSVFTVGGVISPGETAMFVVPENDRLVVDAMIEPQDIEHVRPGQRAQVRFSAFSNIDIRHAEGEVATISPDLIEDQATRRRYYKVKLSVTPPPGPDGLPLTLLPGMTAEAFLIKGDRSVLAYLVKPISDQMSRVFRE